MDSPTLIMSFFAMLISTVFFVGGKVVMARFNMPWVAYWRWSLGTAAVIGLGVYLLLGAPAVPGWQWCLGAGMVGSLAHVFANTALKWGEASLLVPISAAKPVVLLVLTPLFTGAVVGMDLTIASLLATVGVVIAGLTPRPRHHHAPHPTIALVLMIIATACMATSDLVGNQGLEQGRGGDWQTRIAAIALWNAGLGILPALSFLRPGWAVPRMAKLAAATNGGVFALYIAIIAAAFQLAPNPALAVPTVNVVISLRGVCSVLLVLVIDRWFRMGLEPVPRWVHGLRLLGAVVLVAAVALAS